MTRTQRNRIVSLLNYIGEADGIENETNVLAEAVAALAIPTKE